MNRTTPLPRVHVAKATWGEFVARFLCAWLVIAGLAAGLAALVNR